MHVTVVGAPCPMVIAELGDLILSSIYDTSSGDQDETGDGISQPWADCVVAVLMEKKAATRML